jgi:ribosomal protein S18 acetylase RimI-like enzyme
METIIRHYQPSDTAVVLEISADTAFFGEPVEAFLEDRRLFTDAFTAYYLEFEARFAWVAETSGSVTGFLLGCADTRSQSRHWRGYVLQQVLLNALMGRYRLGRKTASFAWGMFLEAIRGEEVKADLYIYPAHLQIDVKAGFRGQGVGRMLIEAYLHQLRQLNILGVYLETTSHNEAACHLYEKVGFQLLDERLNRFWTHMLGYAVDNRSYGLKLLS